MAISGVGLGFRRDLADELLASNSSIPRFVEFAPENWAKVGGILGRKVKAILEKYPVIFHGLSLSLGSPEPLNWELLKVIKEFLRDTHVEVYSEHLSYTKCDNAHLYDLLPIPFREDAIKHVSTRIRETQDFLERRLAIENVSYYTPVAPEMDEATFIKSIIGESDCNLLLDVNNVYVNAFNHGYDAKKFIESLPLDKVAYIHMAGHEKKSADLIIDSHGTPIIDPVFELFEWTIARVKPVPVLLERDFNLPKLFELEEELFRLDSIMSSVWESRHAA